MAAQSSLTCVSRGDLVTTTRTKAALLRYLVRHGQHVTSLSLVAGVLADPLTAPGVCLLPLPPTCRGLRALSLKGLDFEHTHVLNNLAALSSLTSLEISGCRLMDGVHSLVTAVSGLTALRTLSVDDLSDGASGTQIAGRVARGLSRGLTGLTALSVDGNDCDRALKHLSCLTQLERLRLERTRLDDVDEQELSAAAYSGLEHLQRLTCCELIGSSHVQFTCASTPGLQQLTALQQLELHSYDLGWAI